MDILNQFEGKISGTLETFDRVIINGYIQCLHSFRLFLYYLIQKNVLLKDFDAFAKSQTDSLCSHIESYINEQGCPLTYLATPTVDSGCLFPCPHKIDIAFSGIYTCCLLSNKEWTRQKMLSVKPLLI